MEEGSMMAGASPALQTLLRSGRPRYRRPTTVFGDNAYPKGIPKKGMTITKRPILAANLQLEVMKQFPGKIIFIPVITINIGSKRIEHRKDGWRGIRRGVFSEDGCPIETVVYPMTSCWSWSIHNGTSPLGPLPLWTTIATSNPRTVFEELESEIKSQRKNHAHRGTPPPCFRNGPHGGQYSLATTKCRYPYWFVKTASEKRRHHQLRFTKQTLFQWVRKRLIALAITKTQNGFCFRTRAQLYNTLYKTTSHKLPSGSGSKLNPTKNTMAGCFFSYGAQLRVPFHKDGWQLKVSFVSCNDPKNSVFNRRSCPKTKVVLKIEFNSVLP